MSANYWSSTQRQHWQFTRPGLKEARKELKLLEMTMCESQLISKIPLEYDVHMRIYIHSLVNKLGRKLSIRQIALSTAEVYLMRFLTRVSLKEINLYLLITTSVYLACKIEECPQHIRTIVSEARNLWPEYIPHDSTKLAEFEFYLIEELETYLIVHHPYRSLFLINDTLMDLKLTISNEDLQSAWSIINDSYVTDLHLLFPPHIIAVSAIYMTIVLKFNHFQHLHKDQKDSSLENCQIFTTFLGNSNINLNQVIEAVQELITLYEVWETYDESSCKKPLEAVLLNR